MSATASKIEAGNLDKYLPYLSTISIRRPVGGQFVDVLSKAVALHQHNSLWGPLKQTDTLVTAYYHSNSPLQLCVNGHQCILLRWVNDSGTIRQTALSAPTPSNETTQSATESPWQILAKCKSLFNQQRDSSTLHTDKHLSLRTPDPFILILAWLSVSEVNPILHCLATGNNLVYVYVCACVWMCALKLHRKAI